MCIHNTFQSSNTNLTSTIRGFQFQFVNIKIKSFLILSPIDNVPLVNSLSATEKPVAEGVSYEHTKVYCIGP